MHCLLSFGWKYCVQSGSQSDTAYEVELRNFLLAVLILLLMGLLSRLL